MHLAIKILRWILGVSLILTLLLKEDSEKNIQSLVETWWVKLAYGQDKALSRVTAFLRALARLTGSVFDRLFGKRLFSLRGVGVSVCYSIASFFLFTQLMALTPKLGELVLVIAPVSYLAWVYFFLFLFLGSVPALQQSHNHPMLLIGGATLVATTLIVSTIIVPVVKFMRFSWRTHQIVTATDIASLLLLTAVISTGCDFGFIALTRWMLRKASASKRGPAILGIVSLNSLLGLVLFCGPTLLLYLALLKGHYRISSMSLIAYALMFLGPAVNAIDILACSLFVVLMVLMLVHRLLWPVMEGPIYVFQRYGLIKHKGLLVTAGVSLLFGKSIWAVLAELTGKL